MEHRIVFSFVGRSGGVYYNLEVKTIEGKWKRIAENVTKDGVANIVSELRLVKPIFL
jgi:hypothetical protein